MNDDSIRVAIVEDQSATRDGLAALLDGTAGYEVVGRWASMEEALPPLLAHPPDVLLQDVGLPGMSGIEGIRHLRADHPDLKILVLTVFADDKHVFEAICAGACGYLLKDTPPTRLLEAIAEVHEGGAPMSPDVARRVLAAFRDVLPPPPAECDLSPRELDVLERFVEGHSYKTAAAALDLSVDTVRFHVRRIYQKLHVHSKSEAVLAALRRGLIR